MSDAPNKPGWYPSSRDGFVQYHDGLRWTGEYYPAAETSVTPAASAPAVGTDESPSGSIASAGRPPAGPSGADIFHYRFGGGIETDRRVAMYKSLWSSVTRHPLRTTIVAACSATLYWLLVVGGRDLPAPHRYSSLTFMVMAGVGLLACAITRRRPRWVDGAYFAGILLGDTAALTIRIVIRLAGI